MAIPIYKRLNGKGAILLSYAGVEAKLAPGSVETADAATWHVSATTIDFTLPKPGDEMCSPSREWWVVKSVQPLTDGVFPVECVRKKDGE